MFYFMKKWNEAKKHFIEAIDISRRTGNSRQECIYQGLLGLANFEDGSIQDAIDCYRNTYELIMDHQFPSSIDESPEILRSKLLSEGIGEAEIPYPDHW
jgi:tetratricopeptide (TPR) repeat protein